MLNMKRVVIVATNETKTRQVACQCVQHITLSSESEHPGCGENTFFKVVTPDTGVLQVYDTHPPANGWLTSEEAISLLAEFPQQKITQEWHGNKNLTESENLAKALHYVADTLPYLGATLDIIVCLRHSEGDMTKSQSLIPVIGAVKRLIDWHNGKTVIIKLETGLSEFELQIVDLGQCQVVNSIEKLKLHWPGWRGKVAVMDHIENRGHLLPGFWLECCNWDILFRQKLMFKQQQQTCQKMPLRSTQEDSTSEHPVCGRTIEILQEVDLRTFPFFLVDSWTLYLHFQEGGSAELVNYINSLEQTGLLVRLRIYPDVRNIPVCGTVNLNTALWKDRVITDCKNVQEPPEEQVADVVFLYLLLLPNMQSLRRSSPVVAQVLLSPHEINRNIVCSLQDYVHLQRSAPRESTSDKQKIGDELVLVQKDKFILMLDALKENLGNRALKNQDGAADVTNAKKNITETVAKTQTEIISAVFLDSIRLDDFLQGNMRQQFENTIQWISEAALDSSKFPEKLAMQSTLSTRKTLQSFPSMDSLTVSSPLSTAEVEKKKNFEMSDIFQYFNSDGSVKDLPQCHAKLKGRGLCRIDYHQHPKHQWPESQLLRFHDVYYYNSELDLGLEKRYSKVRDRGYFPDTLSSFMSPNKKHPQTRSTSSLSTERWLQRSASAQNLVTSGTLDHVKRTSPRKKHASSSTLKHRKSQLCSPQNMSQGLHGPTLEFSASASFGYPSTDVRNITRNLKNRSLSGDGRNKQKSLSVAATSVHRKRSLTNTGNEMTDKLEKNCPVLATPLAVNLSCQVRRLPRRSVGSLRVTQNPSEKQSKSYNSKELRNNSFESGTPCHSGENGQPSAKMKRSDRHKLKLKSIIDHVLREKGVDERSIIYGACSRNLFNVCMVLLKTLTTSQNLTEEMKTVVHSQVKQIINLEKRRCGIALDS